MLLCSAIPFPEPGAEGPAPNRATFVEAEFLGHGFTCFSERGSGSFLFDLRQWSYISADGEDDGSGAWEAGESVVLDA